MFNTGTDESTAMKITGHRTASIFNRYRIVNLADYGARRSTAIGTEREWFEAPTWSHAFGDGRVDGRVSTICNNKGLAANARPSIFTLLNGGLDGT